MIYTYCNLNGHDVCSCYKKFNTGRNNFNNRNNSLNAQKRSINRIIDLDQHEDVTTSYQQQTKIIFYDHRPI